MIDGSLLLICDGMLAAKGEYASGDVVLLISVNDDILVDNADCTLEGIGEFVVVGEKMP